MLQIFFSALALLLIFEGILPFGSPKFWRSMVKSLSHQSDRMLRITGLVLMLSGIVVLVIVKLLTL